MNDKKIRVFDLEGDGFNPTKIHCIAFQNSNGLFDTVDYDAMRSFFEETDVLVGHNIIRFDIPVVERLLGIKVKAQLVDTLALSWYLFPNMRLHGLEAWGIELGVAKPEITDWDNLSVEEYVHRCREDVKINIMLWDKCWDYLHKLYSGDETRIWSLIKYLSFKLDCVREQEELGWDADEELINSTLEEYLEEYEGKMELLADAMPVKPLYQTKTIPAKPLKQDGSLSAAGTNWLKMLENEGLPISTKGPVQIIKGFQRANPSSHKQLKEWFVTLGWVPETFKYVKEKDFKERAIPQISLPNGKGVCGSIKKLYAKSPALELLDGIFILQHRIGMLKGFQRDMKDGKLVATINGLTNTLRFKHKGLVNLPKANLQYSKNIRGSLVAPEGYELCGSDMSSLEDRTKQHYIYPYDPDYVDSMLAEDFDPHLDIAELAGMLTTSQVSAHKSKLADYSEERSWAKTTNYCATYGGSGKAVSRQTSLSVKEGNALIKIYWERNWSVKKVAEDAIVKTVNEQTWVWNPVSKFWYSLRFEKDIFSTLNQSTGAYCFDVFVGNLRRNGIKMIGQFHDEVIFLSKIGQRAESTRVLRGAIDKANEILKLNRELDIGIEFGSNYAEVH
jgi:hypothetical protein